MLHTSSVVDGARIYRDNSAAVLCTLWIKDDPAYPNHSIALALSNISHGLSPPFPFPFLIVEHQCLD